MRARGAVPATIAVLAGVPHVGLTGEQLQALAAKCVPAATPAGRPRRASPAPPCLQRTCTFRASPPCCKAAAPPGSSGPSRVQQAFAGSAVFQGFFGFSNSSVKTLRAPGGPRRARPRGATWRTSWRSAWTGPLRCRPRCCWRTARASPSLSPEARVTPAADGRHWPPV